MKNKENNLSGTSICVVCGKPIVGNDCFSMGTSSTPGGTSGYRHKKCGPGSKQWKEKFPQTSESEIVKILEKYNKRGAGASGKAGKTSAAKDPIKTAIKEFCGREKYLRYMDTVNTTIINWTISTEICGRKITHSREQGCIDPDLLYNQLVKDVGVVGVVGVVGGAL